MTPPDTPRGAADDRRDALVEQLRYLLLEVDALGPLLEQLPSALLAARPMGEPSILDAFARIAALDREVRLRHLERALTEDTPAIKDTEVAPPPAPTASEALDDVREAREALIAAFKAAEPADWRRAVAFPDGERGTVYDLALRIVRDDNEVLRALTYRMHEAQFSFRVGGE